MKTFNFICLTNSVNPKVEQVVAELQVKASNENQAFVEAAKKAVKSSGFIHLHDCTAHIKKHFAAY